MSVVHSAVHAFPQRSLRLVIVVTLSLACCFTDRSLAAVGEEPGTDDAVKAEFFENRIRPVLVQHCYECHSAEAKGIKGGLVLDSAEGLRAGGDSGPMNFENGSADNLLLQALRHESVQMPPTGRLPDSVIRDFESWIEAGAYDPRTGSAMIVKKAIDYDEARRHWSFTPPVKSELPSVRQADWLQSDPDAFVLAELESRGLVPVRPAGRRELIRRATFDLTGLPPTPEEIDAFLRDDAPDAFARVVDRLLESPHYGERWGRYWLDVARYSEDQAHTFSVTPNTSGYRYRDWVIAAFNSDLPYDQFVRLQIAADLIDAPEDNPYAQLPALGYFGLGPQYYKNTDAAKAAADELDDRIDTLCRGFLGLTVSCARCHDHKFDPIPTQDYYSLAGIFRSTRLHNVPLVPQAEVEAFNAAQKRLKELEDAIAKQVSDAGPALRESRLPDVARYLTAVWELRVSKQQGEKLTAKQLAARDSLSEKVLRRWSEFLDTQKGKSAALRDWESASSMANATTASGDVESSDTAGVPDAVRAAAESFQAHLELLLRKRDGRLTEAEEAELKTMTPAGNARYESRIVTKREPLVEIDLDVSGETELHLVVTDAGDGASCDHADWADARLVFADGERKLTELKWRSATATYGSINTDRNVQGGRLRIGKQTYDSGLGTHSTSVIVYDLPEGVLRFRAAAGLDRSGTDQPGCGDGASVQFRVYTETPSDLSVAQPDLLTLVFGEKGVFAMEPAEMEELLSESVREELRGRRTELESLKKSGPSMYPVAHVIAEADIADMKVFVRGNPASQGDVAPRRFLRILAGDEPPPFRNGSGRLELADAIVSPENPLTARVMVNRLWQHHFGRGLVTTPDNFGVLGERPTHPELLDFLAVRFLESGWSIKAMHREIMLSAVYQLSTERHEQNMAADADNRYLWRMNRRRLDVEAWRDALLSVSGRLDQQMGGPSTNLADAGNVRRTVYAFISRHEPDNMLRLFDFPDANITSSTRSETTVPQQQLYVINSEFMLNQARAFADRLHKEAPAGDEARVQRAFELAFGRSVAEDELSLALAYLQSEDTEEDKRGTSLSRWERYAQILLASNEFLYLD